MAINDIVLGSELGPEFLIGTETTGQITVAVDNTSVVKVGDELTAAPPVFDAVANTLTFPAQGASAPLVVDLTPYTGDIFVTGAVLDAATNQLTLSDNDAGTPDVIVDLTPVLGVSTDANNALSNGADGKPYLDSTTILTGVSTDADQILTLGTDGNPLLTCDTIKTDCTSVCESVFGTALFNAFPA